MQLTIAQATEITVRALSRCGFSEAHAAIVAAHLVDAALCGHEFSSLPRVLAIVDERRKKAPPGPIRTTRDDGCFAHLDGGDNIGYVVSVAAVDKAIEICARTGVAVVTAHNTWFSGRCAYYVERAARRGYVAMHTTNTTARVAPFGGTQRLMGTNPFAIAFPAADDPLVIDIGTSAITWGDVVLLQAKGERLPPGVAVDPAGHVTVDPVAALDGAFLPWGGARGGALAVAIQLLGVLAGSNVVIEDTGNYGLFFVLIDPERIAPGGRFKRQVSEMRRVIAANRPLSDAPAVRVPGDGSQEKRRRATATGVIDLDDQIYARITALGA